MPEYSTHYQESHALVVGINTYSHVPSLQYATNDSRDVLTRLLLLPGFAEERTRSLENSDASRQAILGQLYDLRSKAGRDDRLFFFFAGHGTTISGTRGAMGFLIPSDGDPSKPETLISVDELIRVADMIPAKHQFLVFDACYGGLAITRAVPPGIERFITDVLTRRAVQILTAGKADQTVSDGGGASGQNSVFTAHFLDALAGAASDSKGVLTANLLMSYVYQKVSQDTRSRQTPHYGHLLGDGDFVIRSPGDGHLVASDTGSSGPTVISSDGASAISVSSGSFGSRPSYSDRHAYGNPDAADFGRNRWADQLGNWRRNDDNTKTLSKAGSWLSVICETQRPNTFHIPTLSKSIREVKKPESLPQDDFHIPELIRTSMDAVVCYDRYNEDGLWKRYLTVDEGGAIELAESTSVFAMRPTVKCFRFVQMIGNVWQFMHLSRAIFDLAEYSGEAHLIISVVGTEGTQLTNYAQDPNSEGTRWSEPGETNVYGIQGRQSELCVNRNIQLRYNLNLSAAPSAAASVVKDLATKLSLAYSLGEPHRCFIYGTDTFPWSQFLAERTWF